jgi:glycosyltransferase involved in cell wall biosynthesis
MIAHAFPPEGSAGVYRPLRFVAHLADMGWRPCVVSCEGPSYERYDPGLLELVPPGVEVRRVGSHDPWQSFQARRAKRIERRLSRQHGDGRKQLEVAFDGPVRAFVRNAVRRVESWCYHPDLAMRWIKPAVQEVVRQCAESPVDAIYATAGPVSAFVVAHRVFRKTGIPYVLDFRDAWTITDNDFEALRPVWALRRDRRNLHRMLKDSRAVIFRYPAEAECYWRAYAGALDASRIHIIPNGYDGPVKHSAIPAGAKCTIVYTGTLSSYRFDTFLQALRTLKQSDPARASRLRVRFVGEGTAALSQAVEALQLTDLVEIAGPIAHAAVSDLHRSAHALLVLGRPATMKGYELFAGAKLFEYMKAGRPIIGVVPHDETRRILHLVGAPTVADVDSPSEIAAVLRKLIEAWEAGLVAHLVPDRTACEAFAAKRQTAALVRALTGKGAADPFVPGTIDIPASLRSTIAGDWLGVRPKAVKPILAGH